MKWCTNNISQPVRVSKLKSVTFIAFLLWLALLANSAFSTTYEVGPSKPYKSISQVPLDSLEPGDTVKIFYREEPYREKFILRRCGIKNKPIIIEGIPHNEKLPIIAGNHASQTQQEKWPQSGRWLIKVGDGTAGDYVHIKNLELCNANNSQAYREGKQDNVYEDNAAGIFVRYGRNVLISNCVIHACGNGVQTSYGPDVSNLTLSGCFVHDNGNHTNVNSSQEHNVYLCGTYTVIQFCRFGISHSDGNNIKDRGLNTIIRYNWIEGGKNRQLDLVDYKDYKQADAYVYGNVIIQGREPNNNNMIHWGGDSGASRSGTLHLFNNTIIANTQNARFIVVRYPDCVVEMKNNVFLGSGTLWNGVGRLFGCNNWFSLKVAVPFNLGLGKQGNNAVFVTAKGIPYMPGAGSPLINAGTNSVPNSVEYMPQPFGGGMRRPNDGLLDIGAFEAVLPSK